MLSKFRTNPPPWVPHPFHALCEMGGKLQIMNCKSHRLKPDRPSSTCIKKARLHMLRKNSIKYPEASEHDSTTCENAQ